MDKFNSRSLGGHNRAKSLTSKERTEIASIGAKKKWENEKNIPKVTHRGEIAIGNIIIPCAVLDNGVRVLSESGIANAMGSGGNRSGGAIKRKRIAEQEGTAKFPVFMNSIRLEPFIGEVFSGEPIELITYKDSRKIQTGYSATILPKSCEVWLKARDAGALQKQQQVKAHQAEILMRGLSLIGVVALIDEATGYQDERERDELNKLLSLYLSEERLTWAKRFPDEFYRQIYRLKEWKWPVKKGKKTPLIGKLTNQLVYDKLPKGVLAELRERNPTNPGTNRRKWKHHQFLSEDIGQQDLRDHLLQLVAIMKISKNWQLFEANFEAAFPESGQQLRMDIDEA